MAERSSSSIGSATAGFLLGFMVASAGAGVVMWWLGVGSAERSSIDTSRPTIVRQIQQLQRLETVVFGLDKIVAGEKESRYLPSFLAGDRLLLIVFGEVIAGVDLGRIQSSDVTAAGGTIQMTIPAPEIFTTRVDNDRTRVYSRVTGLFSRVDPNLESEVRREAERQVRQTALDNGIMKVATENARATMTSFLRGLGFEQIDLR